MRKAPVFHTSQAPVKRALLRPVELTPDELTRLLTAFVAGKTEVCEADAHTLVTWATAQRMGALIVEMILEGTVVPSVKDGEVLVSVPGRPHEEEGGPMLPETNLPLPVHQAPCWRCGAPSQRVGLRYDPCESCQAALKEIANAHQGPAPQDQGPAMQGNP